MYVLNSNGKLFIAYARVVYCKKTVASFCGKIMHLPTGLHSIGGPRQTTNMKVLIILPELYLVKTVVILG